MVLFCDASLLGYSPSWIPNRKPGCFIGTFPPSWTLSALVFLTPMRLKRSLHSFSADVDYPANVHGDRGSGLAPVPLCSLSLHFGSSGCHCCDSALRPSKQWSFYTFHPAFLSWGLAGVLVWYKMFTRQRTWILSQLSPTTHGISRWLVGNQVW